ncbi:MAG TPA: endo-1,4-beta-xylanase [Bryobacteraceae bacterium]|nr:endo-1,4-beta-xylanase [Bryobacteraceae bacterium]
MMRTLAWMTLLVLPAAGQTPAFRSLWDSPEVVRRIQSGIEENRKGWATLRFVDTQGKPVTGVHAEIEQTSHAFLFGANLFMLGGFDSQAENRLWEERFLGLFNYATTPFYWPTLEPKQGALRFAADSPKIYRRPPPDLAVDFARRHGLTLKGHPLVYDQFFPLGLPEWVPRDPNEIDRLVRIRMEQIAARYRDSIRVWDVFNEVLSRPGRVEVPMPFDMLFRSHQNAARLFPPDTKLSINEGDNRVWTEPQVETSHIYLLLQNLRLRGARVDAIGFQCHLWGDSAARMLRGEQFRPVEMLRNLDRYADFHLPVHITEVTIPTSSASAEGEAEQALLARSLYRLWFSHPAVEAITWWNLADGTAFGDENKHLAGLVHKDLSPKLSYQTLRKLIREEWHTKTEINSAGASEIRFQGFYGRYRAVVRYKGQVKTVEFPVAKGALNVVEVKL